MVPRQATRATPLISLDNAGYEEFKAALLEAERLLNEDADDDKVNKPAPAAHQPKPDKPGSTDEENEKRERHKHLGSPTIYET